MKLFLLFLLLISAGSFAQTADFIQLKKKNKTIATYYSGMEIAFTAENGTYLAAHINGIKNDTLYLQEFKVRYLPTNFGTYIADTVGSFRYKYHYSDIAGIGKVEQKNFNTRGSGAALLGGGVLITLASGVVYAVDRERFSAPLLLAAVGLGTLGYFMAKGKKGTGMTLGKKYRLQYMDMSNEK